MLRRLLNLLTIEDAEPQNGTDRPTPPDNTPDLATLSRGVGAAREPSTCSPSEPGGSQAVIGYGSFDDIYQHAGVRPRDVAYSILKVFEMANSPYLAQMSTEAKRSSLLMAIEAAGVHTEDLLQDALIRQRALNDFEQAQQKKMEELAAAKKKQNNTIQAELDRVTAQYLARMQIILDELARQEDEFRAWKKRKQEESQHIAEAVAFLAPQKGSTKENDVTAVLARCGTDALIGKK